MPNNAVKILYKTKEGLVVYDLDPHCSPEWIVAGPDGFDPRTIDTFNIPHSFRWVEKSEYESIINFWEYKEPAPRYNRD